MGYAKTTRLAFRPKEHPGGLNAAILRPQGRAAAVERGAVDGIQPTLLPKDAGWIWETLEFVADLTHQSIVFLVIKRGEIPHFYKVNNL